MQRNISDLDLTKLTPAKVAALWMNEETFTWLCEERDTLQQQLFDAESNSPEAISLIDRLSVIVGVIDEYLFKDMEVYRHELLKVAA